MRTLLRIYLPEEFFLIELSESHIQFVIPVGRKVSGL